MNRLRFTSLLAAFLSLAVVPNIDGDVKLPAVFSDHAVLQQGMEIAVWGWAGKGEKVTVSVAGKTASGTADGSGKWSLKVGPLEAGGPHSLVVQGKNRIEVKDVLVGDVWLCSGQSNMAMTVSRAQDYEKEKAAAKHPQLRMFTASRILTLEPQPDVKGRWVVCAPDTVGSFSATAYFFGREILKAIGQPIGLINSSYGGASIESWIPMDVQKKDVAMKPILEKWEKAAAAFDAEAADARYQKALARWKERVKKAKAAGTKPPRRPRKQVDPKKTQRYPSTCYNGMLHGLVPYGIKGGLWYQGESNSHGIANLYGKQLEMLIATWRRLFRQEDLPFYYVQLPNFRAPQKAPTETTGWVLIQEQMLKTLKVPHTGMAITIDIGMEKNIHPVNKQEAGRRLSLLALHDVYGKNVVRSGPLYQSSEIKGKEVTIHFQYAEGKLVTRDGGPVKGFAIAGKDQKFVWADARIEGSKVVVSSDKVPAPAAVRYSWAGNPIGNLANSAGLPASPFRTDNWEK